MSSAYRIERHVLVKRVQVVEALDEQQVGNPARFPSIRINTAGATAFADFLVAPGTQEVIGN